MNESDLGLFHLNYQYRNQTVAWTASDNKEVFEQHCQDPEKYKKLKKLGWLDPDCISYRFNSFGFRDDEFDDRPCGLALGCSHTQGIGLPEDSTWPKVLSKLTNTHIWNLGVSGSSIDTAFRLLDHWLPKLSPKFVVFCVPNINRVEVFDQKSPETLMPYYLPEHLQPYFKIWISGGGNARVQKRKNFLAMQHLCNQAGIPFRYLECNYMLTHDHRQWPPGTARDLMHCGPELHAMFAEQIHNLL